MMKKILFAVMALLTMATGKIWAEEGGTTTDGSTAYVIYDNSTLYFLCAKTDQISSDKITIDGKEYPLNSGCFWSGDEVLKSGDDYAAIPRKSAAWADDKSICPPNVTKVVFAPSFANARPNSCACWFYGFENLTEIENIENLNTSEVTNMGYMFSGCEKLTSLDLSNFDTSKVTDMNSMFAYSKKLTSLDLSNFDTSKVTNMKQMFCTCSKLSEITFGEKFSTENVPANNGTIWAMFGACSSLRLLDISKAPNFELSKIKNDSFNVIPLTYINPSAKYDTDWENIVVKLDNNSKCTHLVINYNDNTFPLCVPDYLISPFFIADKVTIKGSFKANQKYTLCLPFEINADDVNGTFYTYENYDEENKKVIYSKLTREYTGANKPYLFIPKEDLADGISLNGNTLVYVNYNADSKNWVSTTDKEFIGVYEKRTFTEDEVQSDTYYGWDGSAFQRVNSSTSVDACHAYLQLSDDEASSAPETLPVEIKVYSYAAYDNNSTLYFFCSESELSENGKFTVDGNEITLTNGNFWSGDDVLNSGTGEGSAPQWNVISSSVTKVVFDKSFASARPKSCKGWLEGFNNLTEIKSIENLNTSKVTSMNSMFFGCKNLTSLDLSKFDTENVTDMSYMFGGCSGLTSLTLNSFNTGNVTYMEGMFTDCSGLTSLDLSKFNTSKVTKMDGMFAQCGGLTSLDLSNFNTSNVTDMSYMFVGCSNLRLLDMSKATISDFSKIKTGLGDFRPLTYVPAGTTVSENMENVVVMGTDNDATCQHLVINYNNNVNSDQLLLCVPYPFTAKEITINRNFAADKPYTLCLPFEINANNVNGTFYTYKKYDTENKKVIFSKLPRESTEANMPYHFIPKEDLANGISINDNTSVSVNYNADKTWVPTKDNEFIGVYEKRTFTEEEANSKTFYGWADGAFYRAGYKDNSGASVDACRAYLQLSAEAASSAPARLSVEFGDGETTGISSAVSGAEDGMDAPVYNLQGQRVSGSYKGVVIRNGKKMIMK